MTRATLGRDSRDRTREAIVEVAARLLREQGLAAVTTRGVAQAAQVQPPTIYRLFGDKDGLLDAVAEHVMVSYVAAKSVIAESSSAAGTDPLADLRAGWDMHVEFGLANPSLVSLLTTPGRGPQSPAAAAGLDVLRGRVHRVAVAGRLWVSEPRAVQLIHAAGTGIVLTLLAMPPEERDLGLADAMYDAVSRAILTDAPAASEHNTLAAAVTFRTITPQLAALTDAEQMLLTEWLDRVIDTPQHAAAREPTPMTH